MSVGSTTGAGVSEDAGSGATGQSTGAAAEGAAGSVPFIAIVGLSSGGTGTADRSNPHAPQKRSPESSGSSQLGQAASWGICDMNYTHVRGR
ncbi:hypothetical protein GCM10010515_22260 [Streptomyces fructofermentans]|uniref:Uncharacterized protein n=1 Tax=Streptomyces fructofermentans TaxID=152141 RepID=A0A918N9R9_9ACTN|nr:hypothetical protein GCM10010515_22260 [Streptomyces fructofermentans]